MPQDTLVVFLIVAVVALGVGLAVYQWLNARRSQRISGTATRGDSTPLSSQHDLRGTMTRWHQ